MKTENTTTELSYEAQAEQFAKNNGITLKVLSHKFGKHFEGEKDDRRIFSLELSRKGEKYIFDFGQSIVNSCKKVIKLKSETSEQIEIFAGLTTKGGAECSAKFTLFKKDEFAISDEKMEALVIDMEKQFFKSKDKKNEVFIKKFEAGDISRKEMQSKFSSSIENGAFRQCIMKAIKRELNETEESFEESEEIIEPTMYDVLTCLTKYDPNTFEDFCSEFGYDTDSRAAERTHKAVVKEYEAVERLFGDIIEELAEIQ